MKSLIESMNFSTFGAALLLSAIGLWFSIVIHGINRWSRRFFKSYFIIFLLCCLSSIAELLLQYYTAPRAVFIFLLLLESFLFSLPLLMLTAYLLHCCGENIRRSKLFHAVIVLWTVFIALLVSSLFIDGFIYITPENQYFRGPLYPLPLMPIIAALALDFAGTMRRRTRLSHKVFLAFLIAILPITATLIVQMFADIFLLIDVSYVLSALAMYSFILTDQIETDRRQQQKIIKQQQEIAHERANVMVLQMRPHFIYNTLMSIYSLCRLDPQKAQQLTLDFTNYLRKNFNAVASDSTIPFATELEHTRAYLAVEQAQYEDMLIVDYDTTFTNFRLPPLTLQPIVENAVKHSMNPNYEPLHIFIRTRRTDSESEITVENTGPGFELSDDSKSYITLKNIQQRLEIMCGGSISIMPREGGGTVVKLTIPRYSFRGHNTDLPHPEQGSTGVTSHSRAKHSRGWNQNDDTRFYEEGVYP